MKWNKFRLTTTTEAEDIVSRMKIKRRYLLMCVQNYRIWHPI